MGGLCAPGTLEAGFMWLVDSVLQVFFLESLDLLIPGLGSGLLTVFWAMVGLRMLFTLLSFC